MKTMLKNKAAIFAAGSIIIAGAIAGAAANAQGIAGHGKGGVPGQFRGNQMFGRGMMNRGIVGKVTAINSTTITITSGFGVPNANANAPAAKTYTIDASKATFTKIAAPAAPANGAPPSRPAPAAITISDIAVGDMISVQGTVSGTNVAATAIALMPAQGAWNSPKLGNMIMGKVQTASGSTLTVLSEARGASQAQTTYTVDASNAAVKKLTTDSSGKPVQTAIAAADIAIGDTVRIQGTVSGTNVTATAITDGVFAPQAHQPSVDDINKRIDANPQAAALKTTVNTLKPGLWDQLVNFFLGIFKGRK